MRKTIIAAIALAMSVTATAQTATYDNYSRSSLYSILLQHSSQKYVENVREAYIQQPLSDKFYDHSLSIVALESNCGSKQYEKIDVISKFLEDNKVAQRLVAKWFNRNKEDGSFDINLLMERGYYDANLADMELAAMQKRGDATLADAGEELIGNTFVVVYDIIYIDKEESAEKARKGLSIASSILSVAASFVPGGSVISKSLDLASDMADMAADLTQMIAGFNVKINAHLFQLEWNEEIANTFYALYYIERGQSDPEKAAKWAEASSLFKMKYIGSSASNSSKTVSRGLYSPEDVIRKVVYRALNNSVAELQRDNEVFRVKVPVSEVGEGKLLASIGMKEGVRTGDIYEVLERATDANGRIVYRKKGTVSPVKIWDNRYMAVEEGAENAGLNMTEFKILSGTDFYPGLLLRQK